MKEIVTTQWKHDMVFESDNPNSQKLAIDASQDFGGTDSGLRPKALMLSALAGCSGLDVVSLLNKMRAMSDGFEIVTKAELTEEHPKIYNAVMMEYHFYGKELNEEKIKKAVHMSIEKYCGVFEMFRHFAEMETAIIFHEE